MDGRGWCGDVGRWRRDLCVFLFPGLFLYKLSRAFFLLFCGLCGHKHKPIKIQMTKTSYKRFVYARCYFSALGRGRGSATLVLIIRHKIRLKAQNFLAVCHIESPTKIIHLRKLTVRKRSNGWREALLWRGFFTVS